MPLFHWAPQLSCVRHIANRVLPENPESRRKPSPNVLFKQRSIPGSGLFAHIAHIKFEVHELRSRRSLDRSCFNIASNFARRSNCDPLGAQRHACEESVVSTTWKAGQMGLILPNKRRKKCLVSKALPYYAKLRNIRALRVAYSSRGEWAGGCFNSSRKYSTLDEYRHREGEKQKENGGKLYLALQLIR